MKSWLRPPVFDDAETTRRARLLHRLLLAMALLTFVGAGSSLLDERNDIVVTAVFYGITWAWFAVVMTVVRAGRVVLAAWVFSIFFWVLIAAVTFLFGGMQGQNASLFAVCTLLIGSVIGGRAALVMALASSVWCAFVAYLEFTDGLPEPFGPYTPVNAWSAVTITVLLTAVLLQVSLDSLRRVHSEAVRAANERDEALRQSFQGQKMELVGNLTSGIAHDLNNLLTVITGTTEILRSRVTGGDSQAQALLNDLDAATSRATLMTRQLLTFGRVPATEIVPVDFGAVVTEMESMLPRLLGSTVAIRVNAESDCWVMGSRSGLEQILLNLAVNGRDAMPTGGEFFLTLTHVGPRVQLEARDSGVGMSRAVQDKIFEPFFSTKASGTGLGLSTVHRLVELYGGSIEVESKSGAGTCFRIMFQAVDAPQKVSDSGDQLEAMEPGAPRQKRILLVEDDPLVRSALKRGLEQDGYAVSTAANGVEAIVKLEKHKDLTCVISDVMMPQMDGVALAAHIAETRPQLPLILISGNQEPKEALIPQLPRIFLMKPVAGDDLRDAIARVTAGGNTAPSHKS
jgi:signal transduction histidine kinase/ActR/RegA family two-component response regulator